MAKKKLTTETPVTITPAELALAERVLVSQGRAIGLLPGLPVDMQKQLAALCDAAGQVLPEAVEGVKAILTEYYTAQKATVEDDAAA
jgi:hypothetical protein